MHGKLNIRATGLDADLADHCDRCIPHRLVFAVGERLRGSNGDGIAGVNAHGIEVLNRADDDHVVGEIAHHFEFVFLPAENRFFNQNFVYR